MNTIQESNILNLTFLPCKKIYIFFFIVNWIVNIIVNYSQLSLPRIFLFSCFPSLICQSTPLAFYISFQETFAFVFLQFCLFHLSFTSSSSLPFLPLVSHSHYSSIFCCFLAITRSKLVP